MQASLLSGKFNSPNERSSGGWVTKAVPCGGRLDTAVSHAQLGRGLGATLQLAPGTWMQRESGLGINQQVAGDIRCTTEYPHGASCNAILPNASPNDSGKAFPVRRAIRFLLPKNSQ